MNRAVFGACERTESHLVTNGTEIKFPDLNHDCILLIVEQLDFADLLSMAQVNHQFSDLAFAVFKQKYANTQFAIESYLNLEPHRPKPRDRKGPKYIEKFLMKLGGMRKDDDANEEEETQNNRRPTHFEHSDRIEILSHGMSLSTLKHFGKFMQKLKLILMDTENREAKQIIEFVNRFCSETLVEIEFVVRRKHALHGMTAAFEKVQHVILNRNLPQRGRNSLAMNESFPQLRELSMKMYNMESDYINCHFEHLEHVYLDGMVLSGIDGFLAANPHIRSVYLSDFYPNFLSKMNRMLPNLEELTLLQISAYEDRVQTFRNVRKFKLENSNSSPKYLLLPNLRELDVNFRPEGHDDWIKFLEKHNQVTKLRIRCVNLNDGQFQAITHELTNLVEISITSWYSISLDVNAIVRFLDNHSQFERFSVDLMDAEDIMKLRKKLDNKWTVTNSKFGAVLERQNGKFLK